MIGQHAWALDLVIFLDPAWSSRNNVLYPCHNWNFWWWRGLVGLLRSTLKSLTSNLLKIDRDHQIFAQSPNHQRNNRGSFSCPCAKEGALTLIYILIFWVQVTQFICKIGFQKLSKQDFFIRSSLIIKWIACFLLYQIKRAFKHWGIKSRELEVMISKDYNKKKPFNRKQSFQGVNKYRIEWRWWSLSRCNQNKNKNSP